ncbi:hypothetical protein ACFFX0_25855 [Citricoccus parietis]|uniref:Uncharacterized protein n=1 Tax=Citricoccus parietis TaxID=592307 RepID=A0ABV5G7M6_9MICC
MLSGFDRPPPGAQPLRGPLGGQGGLDLRVQVRQRGSRCLTVGLLGAGDLLVQPGVVVFVVHPRVACHRCRPPHRCCLIRQGLWPARRQFGAGAQWCMSRGRGISGGSLEGQAPASGRRWRRYFRGGSSISFSSRWIISSTAAWAEPSPACSAIQRWTASSQIEHSHIPSPSARRHAARSSRSVLVVWKASTETRWHSSQFSGSVEPGTGALVVMGSSFGGGGSS